MRTRLVCSVAAICGVAALALTIAVVTSPRRAKETSPQRARVQLWERGPYWATTNIGADKPEDYGLYFWWGDTIGYRREGDAWVANDGSSSRFRFPSEWETPTCYKDRATLQSEEWCVLKDGTCVLAPDYDAAHVHWGGGWRMPTQQELIALVDKCDWTRTTQNGVRGYIVHGRGNFSSESIFLPCAGEGHELFLVDADKYGYYWSSVPYSNTQAFYLGLFHDGSKTSDASRSSGSPIRPIQGYVE